MSGASDPRSLAERLAEHGPAERAEAFGTLSPDELRELGWNWGFWSRPCQRAPGGWWRVWLIMAGRGFGKTRAGAEWVRARAEADGTARIALVGATIAEARAVMVEGESGLLAIAPADCRPRWEPSLGRLSWPGGAQAFVYSAAEPESLRGPQHDSGWADEVAKWPAGEAAWNNLVLGMRRGDDPRIVATTTPRPVPLVRRLTSEAGVAVTRGRTHDNRAHLAPGFIAAVRELYGGTRLGRQELDGELIEEVEGALWTRENVETSRVPLDPSARLRTGLARDERSFRRIVIGVDPPASAGGVCGIVACGLGADGIGYVLGDHSAGGLSPEGWARRVVAAAEAWGAELVVAETNQGGEMVESVLRSVDAALPVRAVRARYGKSRRAEPVAARFTAGAAKLAGVFPELEDELCGMVSGGVYEGPGRSPDRADAMVWAMSELLLGAARAEPRVMLL